MCDYSAETVQQRAAQENDQLITARISPHTVGLVSPDNRETAVCLLSGAKLIVSDIPAEERRKWGVGVVASGTFEQIEHEPNAVIFGTAYRDGVRFESGQFVLFQNFPLGVGVSVELLPAEEKPEFIEQRVLEPAE